jgi:hypothetical protein
MSDQTEGLTSRGVTLLRRVGMRALGEILRDRAWSQSSAFGLVCDLSDVPPALSPTIDIAMEPRAPGQFTGFSEELSRVTGDDYIEVDQRVRLCNAGVDGLHVASDPEGRPIYAQWLIDADNQAALHRATHGQFPQLAQDETLVEGAYTFVDFRRLGAMGEGSRQLLVKAAEEGAARCYTYVSIENVPSLRGVARAGFDLDHVRVTTFRLGRRHIVRRPPLTSERVLWEEATKPKQPVPAA